MGSLGLGLAALGRPGYINLGHADDLADGRDVDALRARTHAVLDRAWAAGIRHFDAARSYGLGEQFLGDWLALHPGRRTSVTIGSKWGYTYVADWRVDVDTHETKDHSIDTFERQWPETLAGLGSEPDLYLIHSVTPDSPALSDHALLDRLGALASKGVRVGVSTSGPRQAEVLTAALRLGGSSPFSAAQSTWNLLEPSAGPALREAVETGWHVTLKETVANGRLTARGDAPQDVVDLAARVGCTPDAVALAAALAQPADVVLVGPSTIGQLDDNLASRDVQLAGSDLAALAHVREEPAAYWSARSRLPWT